MLQLLELVLRLVPLLARLARLGEGVEAAIKSSANKPRISKGYLEGRRIDAHTDCRPPECEKFEALKSNVQLCVLT